MRGRVSAAGCPLVLTGCEPIVAWLFSWLRRPLRGPRPRRVVAGACRPGFRGQPVAEPEMGMDEAPVRQSGLELDPELAYIHVDRAVTGAHLLAPHQAEQLLAGHDPVGAPGQFGQKPQLADREHEGAPV